MSPQLDHTSEEVTKSQPPRMNTSGMQGEITANLEAAAAPPLCRLGSGPCHHDHLPGSCSQHARQTGPCSGAAQACRCMQQRGSCPRCCRTSSRCWCGGPRSGAQLQSPSCRSRSLCLAASARRRPARRRCAAAWRASVWAASACRPLCRRPAWAAAATAGASQLRAGHAPRWPAPRLLSAPSGRRRPAAQPGAAAALHACCCCLFACRSPGTCCHPAWLRSRLRSAG